MLKIYPLRKLPKLYDLMLMVFKYQVVNCSSPQDILLVTLNHLDAIKDCARPYLDLTNKVKNLYSVLVSNYYDLSRSDYECLYTCINAFLEDLNIRVSVLMKLGMQLPSGDIVIKANKDPFLESHTTEEWKLDIPITSFEFEGARNSTLGTNIYTLSATVEPTKAPVEPQPPPIVNATSNIEKEPQGIEELCLLTRLIGKCKPSNIVPEIMLASPNEETYDLHIEEAKESGSVVNIDASKKSKEDLEKICSEFVVSVEEKQKFDILELLDAVETNST